MEYGIVYLLTNPVMPGLVKIGMTTQEYIDKRMKELYTTGVPVPFECQFACKVKKGDCAKIEKALHTAFAPQRINANLEDNCIPADILNMDYNSYQEFLEARRAKMTQLIKQYYYSL